MRQDKTLYELVNLSLQHAENRSARCYKVVQLDRIEDNEERENALTACKSNRDGECDWTACPQRQHYRIACPLLDFALIEEEPKVNKTQLKPKKMTEPKPLEPIDLDRCQAEIPSGYSFMTLGGRPGERIRCTNKPACIAIEKEPGDDGQHGAMSLCAQCFVVINQQLPGRAVFAMLPQRV